MGRRCSVVQFLTIIIGLLNFIFGVPILLHYFLRNHEYQENDEVLSREPGEQLRKGHDDGRSWSWNVSDIIRLIVVLILLLILTSSSIGCVWSRFKSKYQELLARGALILLKLIVVICALNCLTMFIMGYHWMNLMPLCVWGCVVQVIFCFVVSCYVTELTIRRGDNELTMPV